MPIMMHLSPCPLGLHAVEIIFTMDPQMYLHLWHHCRVWPPVLALMVHACLCSYILITISTGTEPTNKLWYIEVASLPKKADGGLDMSSYDLR